MTPTKQNLFLFFEENEMTFVIDSKLVKLYMNRCIIDEDAKFEIVGVYELQKVTYLMGNRLNPLYKTNAYQRTYKEAVDRDIFTDAIEKACSHETNFTDNHFIIGSTFHAVYHPKNPVINRIDKFLDWLLDEMKSQEIKNLYVTFVNGKRHNLISNELHNCIYYVRDHPTDTWLLPGARNEPLTIPALINDESRISVNEDFELSIELIRRGRRLSQNFLLFLHPKLNPYEIKLIEKKDESFSQSFTGHWLADHDPRIKVDVSDKELKYFPESDPGLRYVSCYCRRSSFYLKSSYQNHTNIKIIQKR